MPLLAELRSLLTGLAGDIRRRHDRRVPVGDLLTDRWETAKAYGFGEGSSCYDNVLIIGDVKVGRECWIGPNCILDGSGGGLVIGDYCAISAGAQIYTHDTVAWCVSRGKIPKGIRRGPVRIGDGVYLGPQSVVSHGVTIGDGAVIGALSLVNSHIPSGMRAWGCPARVIGPAGDGS